MENKDTIHLLKECDAGSKMAVTSLDEVMESVQDEKLKELLKKSKDHHEKLGNEIHSMLIQFHSEEKDPNPMAKSMSWLKTNMKMTMDKSDATVADLLTDGCNMGIKSLYKYMNQYPNAESKVKNLCNNLIDIERELRKDLRSYL
ncbi:MAG: hypothetical protein IKL49_00795 [Lachnospiraceae bacterium]|nr:hypothetical protein [Lachnospiraceae bacterium]